MTKDLQLASFHRLLIDNSELFCSETPKKISYEETFKISDIDKTFINQLPNVDFISLKFSYEGKGDGILVNIHSVDDIKEENSGTYLENEDVLHAYVTIEKALFLKELYMDNVYVYFKINNFMKQLDRIRWKNESERMYIISLEEVEPFSSDFLTITPFQLNYEDNFERKISSASKERFDGFNDIYTSVYDDVKLKSYFDYPLTWYNKAENDYSNTLKIKMIKSFFQIICNKSSAKDKYLIRGNKTVTVLILNDEIQLSTIQITRELFEFLLDTDKHHDKLSLLRNTITIFLDSESNTKNYSDKSSEILKTTKYNFDLYIQDKVKLFLDQKNKLLQEFIGTAKKIEDLTSSLISQIRSVALSLLGTVFLSLLSDITKSKTRAILNIALLSYILYFVINIILVFFQGFQITALKMGLKNFTSELGVVGEQGENNLSYSSLESNYLKKSLNIYQGYRRSIIICLIFLVVFFILFYLSSRFGLFPNVRTLVKFLIGY